MTTNKDQAWQTLIAGVKEAAERGMNGEPVAAYSLSRYEEVTGGPVSVKLNPHWERSRKRLHKEKDMAKGSMVQKIIDKAMELAAKKAAAIPKREPDRIFTAYQDISGQWRWRMQARNGHITGGSMQDFHDRYNAIRAATKEASFYGDAAVVKVD